jgi:hypothetical protein
MYGYIYKMRWTAPSNMEQINMLHVDIFYALSNAILYSIGLSLNISKQTSRTLCIVHPLSFYYLCHLLLCNFFLFFVPQFFCSFPFSHWTLFYLNLAFKNYFVIYSFIFWNLFQIMYSLISEMSHKISMLNEKLVLPNKILGYC